MFWRGVVGYLPANLVQGVVGLLSIVVFTRLLSPQAYGAYALAFSVMTLVHTCLFTWLEAAMARFHARETVAGQLPDHFATLYRATAALALVAPLIGGLVLFAFPLQQPLKIAVGAGLLAIPFRSLAKLAQERRRAAGEVRASALLDIAQTAGAFAVGAALAWAGMGGAVFQPGGRIFVRLFRICAFHPRLLHRLLLGGQLGVGRFSHAGRRRRRRRRQRRGILRAARRQGRRRFAPPAPDRWPGRARTGRALATRQHRRRRGVGRQGVIAVARRLIRHDPRLPRQDRALVIVRQGRVVARHLPAIFLRHGHWRRRARHDRGRGRRRSRIRHQVHRLIVRRRLRPLRLAVEINHTCDNPHAYRRQRRHRQRRAGALRVKVRINIRSPASILLVEVVIVFIQMRVQIIKLMMLRRGRRRCSGCLRRLFHRARFRGLLRLGLALLLTRRCTGRRRCCRSRHGRRRADRGQLRRLRRELLRLRNWGGWLARGWRRSRLLRLIGDRRRHACRSRRCGRWRLRCRRSGGCRGRDCSCHHRCCSTRNRLQLLRHRCGTLRPFLAVFRQAGRHRLFPGSRHIAILPLLRHRRHWASANLRKQIRARKRQRPRQQFKQRHAQRIDIVLPGRRLTIQLLRAQVRQLRLRPIFPFPLPAQRIFDHSAHAKFRNQQLAVLIYEKILRRKIPVHHLHLVHLLQRAANLPHQRIHLRRGKRPAFFLQQ